MAEVLAPDRAIECLRGVFQEDGEPSVYIAAFTTPAGLHLATNRQAKTTAIWLETVPPAMPGIAVTREYAADEPRNSNLNHSRGSRLAVGNPAVVVSVESHEALGALIDWYGGVETGGHGNGICLLGTVSDYDDDWFRDVSAFIVEHGGWASWWSFRIKEEARPLLKMPFWLYINRGGNSIIARALVEEMAAGDGPILSPWQNLTKPQWRDRTDNGPSASQVFKTWLRLVKLERLPMVLTRDDFEPIEGLSTYGGLLNQSTFGYARLKTNSRQDNKKGKPTVTGSAQASLNTILYGPPGTSKTFETIDYALSIVDPTFLGSHTGNRTALKERFDKLVGEGRIEFVTFHQSYSYEDFVQGIRASTDNGAISYRVEDGAFKRICLRAITRGGDDAFRKALDDFKQAIADEPMDLKTKTGKPFSVTWQNGKTLRLRPHASKEDADYAVSIENIEGAYRGEDEKAMYNVSYVRAVMAHIKNVWNVPDYNPGQAKKPYVLIIDEINRGNIASIFGELITLIEPSKRKGQAEALEATLAYTTETGAGFSVPDNLYIIGTMNTADRSLARVDTALRRRFDFVPMYPKPECLDGVVVEGVDLGRLLRRMNDRIEVLYDRDHLIGHAYFMGMAQDPAQRTLLQLAAIFRNKILPLLEEYFFEDWKKIRLVLGDNQKQSESDQFVLEQNLSSAGALFGDAEIGTEVVRYRRNDTALLRADSYRLVYGSA